MRENKLTVNQISRRIGSGLKVQYDVRGDGEVFRLGNLTGVRRTTDLDIFLIEIDFHANYDNHCKPILRNLSSLTKTIKYKGGTIVLLDVLKQSCSDELRLQLDDFVKYRNYADLPYWFKIGLYFSFSNYSWQNYLRFQNGSNTFNISDQSRYSPNHELTNEEFINLLNAE